MKKAFLFLIVLSACYLIKGGIPLKDEVLDYRFKRLGGGYSTLREFSEDTILIYLFTSYCIPCIKDIEYLNREMEYFHRNGVSIIGLGMDYNGEVTLVPFRDYYNIKFPLMMADKEVFEGRWVFGQISVIPSTIIIKRRENRYFIVTGNINRDILLKNR